MSGMSATFDAPADTNNVQPRLGVAWDIRTKGHLTARGGAGVYTQQHLLAYINRVQLEGEGGRGMIGRLRSASATLRAIGFSFDAGALASIRLIRS